MNRRQALTGFAAAAAATVLVTPGRASADSAEDHFPTIIPLPDNWLPEGIAIGALPFAYFGSRADGSIYRANLAAGTGKIIHRGPGVGFPSVGLKIDSLGRLFVSGGNAGQGRVVSAINGELLATYQLTTAPSFINDVVLTPDGPYFTNSPEAALYHLPLGRFGGLPAADGFQRIPLGGDWQQTPGFNANGIARTPDGQGLLVVQSSTGLLFRVHPRTGVAAHVDLGGYLLADGDGLLVEGRTLYVVQNRSNMVAVLMLDSAGTSGSLVTTLTDERFDVPTTVASFHDRLYLPNAKFRAAGEPVPTEFEAVAIPKP